MKRYNVPRLVFINKLDRMVCMFVCVCVCVYISCVFVLVFINKLDRMVRQHQMLVQDSTLTHAHT